MNNHLAPFDPQTFVDHLLRTSELLAFAYREFDVEPPQWIYRDLQLREKATGRAIQTLAHLLQDIGDEARLELFGRTSNRMTVDLAQWWHEHLAMVQRNKVDLLTRIRAFEAEWAALTKLSDKDLSAMGLTLPLPARRVPTT